MNAILVKIRGGDVEGNLDLIENTWRAALPAAPFTYSFLDDDIAQQYQTEQRWQRIVTYSSGLAILIACMGLFGLAILTVARRTREIGIRKVLGASIPGVAGMVSREFAILVVVAGVVAAPVAYFAMNRWLENFAYRIDIGPAVFVLSAGIAFAVAMTTIGFQALKAAHLNPVETLRHE
jgi:putative ABC transport system permease protein